MAEYIERSAAIEAAKHAWAKGLEPSQYIEILPAADVAQVVRGRWENGNPTCPVCGENKFKDLDADIWCDWLPSFCPNCGAKMDGGDNTER